MRGRTSLRHSPCSAPTLCTDDYACYAADAMKWQAEWHVFKNATTEAPPFLVPGQAQLEAPWWCGILVALERVLDRRHNLEAPKFANYLSGRGTPPHDRQTDLLHTQCLMVSNGKGLCSEHASTFKWQPQGRQQHSHSSRGANAGYIKLREHGLYPVNHVPWRECYLHQLLHWMYRGPPLAGAPACRGHEGAPLVPEEDLCGSLAHGLGLVTTCGI